MLYSQCYDVSPSTASLIKIACYMADTDDQPQYHLPLREGLAETRFDNRR